MHPKVAIVILNYLNDADTVACVESAFRLEGGPYDIILVDNASANGAYERLQARFGADKRVTLLQAPKNLGFAKGNNLGIRCARRQKKADFVLVVNNDTLFTDPAYITKMLAGYAPGIGMMGSAIRQPNGKIQPRFFKYFAWKSCWYNYLNICSAAEGACFDFPLTQFEKTEILHGCALLFTPDFFRHYRGFYPRTFLYSEEGILYLMCLCRNLRQSYLPDVEIYHKEGGASEVSFSRSSVQTMKFTRQSYKYLLWWRLKAALLRKMPRQ